MKGQLQEIRTILKCPIFDLEAKSILIGLFVQPVLSYIFLRKFDIIRLRPILKASRSATNKFRVYVQLVVKFKERQDSGVA